MARWKLLLSVAVALGACRSETPSSNTATDNGGVVTNGSVVTNDGEAAVANENGSENALAQADSQVDSAPRVGRCSADYCSWRIIRSKTLVRRSSGGSLYRLVALGGTSRHPIGADFPENADEARIEWNPSPYEIFVFCSATLPAVMLPGEDGLDVELLNFHSSIPGAQESPANLYTHICNPGEDWRSRDFSDRFVALEQAPEVDIRQPEDIFRFVQ